ncbi:hypothetical protein ABZ897_56355 [Nonomuraea sp. NPDC046802]|uniref:hypothetical protein n=1 Tax=Nonomuraea sp. NPDC046802 TaxID=3154919 RepID=UPI0033F9A327
MPGMALSAHEVGQDMGGGLAWPADVADVEHQDRETARAVGHLVDARDQLVGVGPGDVATDRHHRVRGVDVDGHLHQVTPGLV